LLCMLLRRSLPLLGPRQKRIVWVPSVTVHRCVDSQLDSILYIWVQITSGSLKKYRWHPDEVQNPFLAEMKWICAWKFVRSSYIGRDISGQNYFEDTISLNKMTSFSL
jgi:hypothetical protein